MFGTEESEKRKRQKKHPVKLGHRFVSFLKIFCHLVCHCNSVFLKEDLPNIVVFLKPGIHFLMTLMYVRVSVLLSYFLQLGHKRMRQES